jgi:hypothetical protein
VWNIVRNCNFPNILTGKINPGNKWQFELTAYEIISGYSSRRESFKFSQFKREIAICIVRQYIEKMTIPDKFSTPASVFMASH